MKPKRQKTPPVKTPPIPMTHEGIVLGSRLPAPICKLREVDKFWVSESGVRYWKGTGIVRWPLYMIGKIKLLMWSVRKLEE